MSVPTEKEIEKLEAEHDKLRSRLYKLEQTRVEEIDRRTREARKQFTVEADAKYTEKIDKAREALRVAKEQHESAVEARALAGVELPYPIGTRLVEWEMKRYPVNGYVKTGRIGMVEVCTRKTEHPDNMRWSRPRLGDWFVRHLKKDGTPGKQYEIRWKENWLPEGMEHPRAAKSQA